MTEKDLIGYKSDASQRAAVLDSQGAVIGEAYDVKTVSNIIPIAHAFPPDQTPVNINYYKISRSQRNLKKAAYTPPISRVDYSYGSIWTFHAVEKNVVKY